jgi:hypothetical protein
MTTYNDSRIIILNSSTATTNNSTMNSNVFFPFLGLLKEDTNIQSNSIQLIDAQMPMSFYIINTTNNVLTYVVSSVSYIITIPVGNYNGNTLITVMITKFLANGHTITPTISKINGILTFTGSSINFTFKKVGSTIFTILGFTADSTSSSFILIATYPLNLLGIKRLTITSNSLAVNGYSSLISGMQNILGTIELDQPTFGLVVYRNLSNMNSMLKVNKIDGIDISIFDEDGNFIDFNNINWTMKFILTSTRHVIIQSPSSFSDIVSPKIQNDLGNSNNNDNDLDLLLYEKRNAKK